MEINNFLKAAEDIPHAEYMPLSELTTFRIGGPARVVLFPENVEQIVRTFRYADDYGIPFRVLGNGSDLLAPDGGFDGAVVCLNRSGETASVSGTVYRCPAGMPLSLAAKESVAMGLSGMEGLEGIPGTVGGACAMNAGAYGYEIKQILKRAKVLRHGSISEIEITDPDLGYRKSTLCAPRTILLEAVFELKPDDGSARERMMDFHKRRIEKQPLDAPSAGSVFKRPEGHYAGSLIEQCGLKGVSVGSACVSPKHAGFIVNNGRATESNVKELVELIQRTVFDQTGVRLERELKYWNEVD